MCVYSWPGDTPAEQWLSFYEPPVVFAIGGFRSKVKSVKLARTNQTLQFDQDDISLRIMGLPATAPDDLATVLALECDGEPVIDHEYVRKMRKRPEA
jgi:hypothetical protein